MRSRRLVRDRKFPILRPLRATGLLLGMFVTFYLGQIAQVRILRAAALPLPSRQQRDKPGAVLASRLTWSRWQRHLATLAYRYSRATSSSEFHPIEAGEPIICAVIVSRSMFLDFLSSAIRRV